MNIGIFGGSFNPVHIGHLIVAHFFIIDFNLEICYFVPNHRSPFKINDQEQLPDHHRLRMLELATASNPQIAIDTFEIDKGGVSFSFETILHFKEKFNSANLYFLIGSDQAYKFTQWKNWETILANANLVVARRNFEPLDKTFLPEKFHALIHFLQNPIIEISSTLVRDLIKRGKPIDYLVPDPVKNYINENKLFTD